MVEWVMLLARRLGLVAEPGDVVVPRQRRQLTAAELAPHLAAAAKLRAEEWSRDFEVAFRRAGLPPIDVRVVTGGVGRRHKGMPLEALPPREVEVVWRVEEVEGLLTRLSGYTGSGGDERE